MITGNRSGLIAAVSRTTLDGGKDLILRAIDMYYATHKGTPGILDALTAFTINIASWKCAVITAHTSPETAKFKRSHAWLVEHAEDPAYSDCWVIFHDGHVIGHDKDRVRLQKKCRPKAGDLVVKMPVVGVP